MKITREKGHVPGRRKCRKVAGCQQGITEGRRTETERKKEGMDGKRKRDKSKDKRGSGGEIGSSIENYVTE